MKCKIIAKYYKIIACYYQIIARYCQIIGDISMRKIKTSEKCTDQNSDSAEDKLHLSLETQFLKRKQIPTIGKIKINNKNVKNE